MLRSCQYCGRIHDSKHDCGKKPKLKKKVQHKDRFRSSGLWQSKREEIKRRDNYLCQICVRGLYSPNRRIETEGLSVHHAETLETAWGKRLDNDNLLTGCAVHHEMMESGEIPLSEVKEIIRQQEAKKITPPGV